jgi:raffinose/stachyose/melibiose transport system permease protein
LAIIWMVPLFFTIATAVRQQGDILANGVFKWPETIYWKNFTDAWVLGKFSYVYRNSLLITFIKVPLGIAVASLAAFPLSKMRFRFRDTVFLFFLMGLTIPVHVLLLPQVMLLKNLGLMGTLWILLPPYIAMGLPFQIFVMRGFFNSIPDELLEAARMDGASAMRIFMGFMIPLSLPALATLFIIDALNTWNEYLMALVFIHGENNYTVPLAMMFFRGEYTSKYPMISSGVLIGMVPILIVYIIFQRFIIGGLTAGALKG